MKAEPEVFGVVTNSYTVIYLASLKHKLGFLSSEMRVVARVDNYVMAYGET